MQTLGKPRTCLFPSKRSLYSQRLAIQTRLPHTPTIIVTAKHSNTDSNLTWEKLIQINQSNNNIDHHNHNVSSTTLAPPPSLSLKDPTSTSSSSRCGVTINPTPSTSNTNYATTNNFFNKHRKVYIAAATTLPHISPSSSSTPPPTSSLALRYFGLGVFVALTATYALTWISNLPFVRYLIKRFIWWAEPRPPALSSFDSLSSNSGNRGSNNSKSSNSSGSKQRQQSDKEGKHQQQEQQQDISIASNGSGGITLDLTPPPELTQSLTALALMSMDDESGEAVEWVNMCWRKAWRVYQRGLERWLAGLLQPVFDNLVAEGMVPKFVQRMRILEFTLDHEAPYFTNMRRRSSRKDSDLNGVVDIRYTGGARMLLLIEVGTGRWRTKFPVLVSDLDLESPMWLKIRLAPMCPWIGTVSLAFVEPPSIKVQLQWQSMRLMLMRVPILQAFLTKLLTIDLPALMTLPQRLEINIPPAVTAVAEAAVGRDAVMRAVASAVLQADALEHALIAALPLGPQGAAGGVSLPDLFQGELQVTLHAARQLPVWGLPWQSNPYVRLTLGEQAVQSRRDSDTSHASSHRAPVWNQEFQFLVEDPTVQKLEIWMRDSAMTGRADLGRAELVLTDLVPGATLDMWLPLDTSKYGPERRGTDVKSNAAAAVHLSVTYKPFEDDDMDSGFREAIAREVSVSPDSLLYNNELTAAAAAVVKDSSGKEMSRDERDKMILAGGSSGSGSGGGKGREKGSSSGIKDIKSAADASSRAAVAASAAAAAVAVTKAAAARAAARLARRKKEEKQKEEDDEEEQVKIGIANRNRASAALLIAAPSSSSSPTLQEEEEIITIIAGTFPETDNTNNNNNNQTKVADQSLKIKQLTQMTATMQQITREVDSLLKASAESVSSSSSPEGSAAAAAEAAVKAVAVAQKLAASSIAVGDVGAANDALSAAAAALGTTASQLAAAASNNTNSTSSTDATDADSNDVNTIDIIAIESSTVPPLPPPSSSPSPIVTPEEKAAQALAAAAAAADLAAASLDHLPHYEIEAEAEDLAGILTASDDEDARLGLDGAVTRPDIGNDDDGILSTNDDDDDKINGGNSSTANNTPPWWFTALKNVPGIVAVAGAPGKKKKDGLAAASVAVAQADGGAGLVGALPSGSDEEEEEEGMGKRTENSVKSWWSAIWPWANDDDDDRNNSGSEEEENGGGRKRRGRGKRGAQQQRRQERGKNLPLGDIILSSELPLDEIAAEVQNSWKLRDTHVETLVQKALQQRQKDNERPWLVLLALMSTASAILLTLVLYKIQHP